MKQQRLGTIALVFLFWLLTAAVGCRAGLDVDDIPEDALIVAGGESTSLAVVSISTGQAPLRLGPLPRYRIGYASVTGSPWLFVLGDDGLGKRVMAGIRKDDLSVSWEASAALLRAVPGVSQVVLDGSHIFQMDATSSIVVADGQCNGVLALIAFSVSERIVESCSPISAPIARSATAIPSIAKAFFFLGFSNASPQRTVVLYRYNHGRIDDSLSLSSFAGLSGGGRLHVVPSDDTSSVYLVAADSIHRIDVQSGLRLASAARPAEGWLQASPDRSQLYLPDPGDGRDDPGSGRVFVYDRQLNLQGHISLGTGARPENPVLNSVAFANEGQLILVSSGTSSFGPLYPSQSGRVFVISRDSMRVLRVIATHDWAPQELFLTQP